MQLNFTTERLNLQPLNKNHAAFIFELLNTVGWLKFIGNRYIHTNIDAVNYIERINSNTAIKYWAVHSKLSNEAIGLVTLIKRDYLQNSDIGFAFLPKFSGNGFAYEASNSLPLNFGKKAKPISLCCK